MIRFHIQRWTKDKQRFEYEFDNERGVPNWTEILHGHWKGEDRLSLRRGSQLVINAKFTPILIWLDFYWPCDLCKTRKHLIINSGRTRFLLESILLNLRIQFE